MTPQQTRTAKEHLMREIRRVHKIRETHPGFGESGLKALLAVFSQFMPSAEAIEHVIRRPHLNACAQAARAARAGLNEKQIKRAEKKARNRK